MSEHIRRAHLASDETYGMPRIRAELADMGIVASRKRLARLLRAMGIQGVSRRRAWCVTTERNKRQRPAPDLVKRVFVAKTINELWVADMDVPADLGGVFVPGRGHRCLQPQGGRVGLWGSDDGRPCPLSAEHGAAYPKARISDSSFGPRQPVHEHCLWQPIAKEMGVRPSMGTVGDAYDNAIAESFFATLECELIARRSWRTKTEARLAVFTWESRAGTTRIGATRP